MVEKDGQYGQDGQGTPPEVFLVGEAGFDPVFPKVNEPIVYYWSEMNRGGMHSDVYHARVTWKDPDGNVIDDTLVECAALATEESATRSTELTPPTKATIGYSIELWVDADHHANFSEGYNYAYHNVDASD